MALKWLSIVVTLTLSFSHSPPAVPTPQPSLFTLAPSLSLPFKDQLHWSLRIKDTLGAGISEAVLWREVRIAIVSTRSDFNRCHSQCPFYHRACSLPLLEGFTINSSVYCSRKFYCCSPFKARVNSFVYCSWILVYCYTLSSSQP